MANSARLLKISPAAQSLRFVQNPVDPEERLQLIALAAYFKAQARGFVPGHETEDWLRAERETDEMSAA